MHLIWWAFSILLMLLLFRWFEPVLKKRIWKDSPLDILQRKFASGEITAEEYEQKKKILEGDMTMVAN